MKRSLLAVAIVVAAIVTYFAVPIYYQMFPPSAGPYADVATVNEIMREQFGHLADAGGVQIFTIVDGNYAVHASNLGEGWRERLFRKDGSGWNSLHTFVGDDACSLRLAGVPADTASSVARELQYRITDEPGHDRTCVTPEHSRF
jgi:hypothetical protein